MVNNVFIDKLYQKNKCDTCYKKLMDYIKFRLFLRKLSKVSPDFNMLWQIADFIKVLTIIYLYDNSQKNVLYVNENKNKDENENGFVLNVNQSKIIFNLTYSDKRINISIRNSDAKTKSDISFNDGEAVIESDHDEQLFININNWLMDAVSNLFKEYYLSNGRDKNKGI